MSLDLRVCLLTSVLDLSRVSVAPNVHARTLGSVDVVGLFIPYSGVILWVTMNEYIRYGNA